MKSTHHQMMNELALASKRVKKLLVVEVPTLITEYLEYHADVISDLESQIGYVIQIDQSQTPSIVVHVTDEDRNSVSQKIHQHVEIAKKRAVNALYEYTICQRGAIGMIGKGMKVMGDIIFPSQYNRINIYSTKCKTDAELRNIFSPYGKILECQLFATFRNNHSSNGNNGFVIFETYNQANRAYNELQHVDMNMVPAISNERQGFASNSLIRFKCSVGTGSGICKITIDRKNDIRRNATLISNSLNRRLGVRVTSMSYLNANAGTTLIMKIVDTTLDDMAVKQALKKDRVHFISVEIERHVEEDTVETALASIISTMQSYGDIELTECFPNETAYQLCGFVKFKEYHIASKVVEELDGIPFLSGYLWMKHQLSESIQFPASIYTVDYLKNEIDLLIEKINDNTGCHVQIKDLTRKHNTGNNKKIFKIRATNHTSLKKAKIMAEKLLLPQQMKLDFKTFSFAQNHRKKFEFIEREERVKFSLDSREKTVSIYGKKSHTERARQKMMIVIGDRSQRHTIPLKYVKAIVGETFKELQQRYKGDITFDFRTRSITINSTAFEIEKFKIEIRELTEEYELRVLGSNFSHTEECSICMENITSPYVMISCGHKVCNPCLSFQIQNQSFECPVCSELLTVPEIQLKISDHSQFDSICGRAVEKHLQNHSTLYRHCPKPSCSDVLKIAKDKAFCYSCNLEYCPKCDRESHPGESCSESDVNKKWIEAHTKKCPKCSKPVEKSAGCNHMTCLCGAHFCWLCCACFENGALTYRHLRAVHGGYDNQPQPQQPQQPQPPQRQEPPVQRPMVVQPPPLAQPPPARNNPPNQDDQVQQRQGILQNCSIM